MTNVLHQMIQRHMLVTALGAQAPTIANNMLMQNDGSDHPQKFLPIK